MTTEKPDPKEFYDSVMPGKLGGDYEAARWQKTPLLSAQYRMMRDVLIRFVLPNARPARRILEVGPGPGTWTKVLLGANSTAAYTLVDISHEMLAQAQKALVGHTNVRFVESDLLAFESSQSFDFFFSSRAIEYMADKNSAIEKIASLLAPGARGAVVTKMPKPLFDRMRGRASSSFHGAQIRPSTLTALLHSSGLAVERVRIATATVPFINSGVLNECIYQLLKYLPLFFPLSLFAESYIVTFHKPL